MTGRAQALWHYYVAFGVLVAAGIACIMMPAAAVISRWFTRSRGTAMGIISAGSSLSAFPFYPLNTWLIASFGWRHALDVYGLVIVEGVGPLAALLYRRHPAGTGDTVWGAAGGAGIGPRAHDHWIDPQGRVADPPALGRVSQCGGSA